MEKVENPMKKVARQLAHIMDDQKKIHEMNEWDREGVREALKEIQDEILKKGYDIHTVMFLAEEYKTLSIKDYYEWKYI